MARHLTHLATNPDLRPLWQAVHDRLCRGNVSPRSVITLRSAGSDTRREVDRLLGRVSHAGPLRVNLGALDDALERAGTTVAAVVSQVVGPVVDRAVLRAEAAADRSAAWQQVVGHPTAAEPEIAAWLGQLHSQGRFSRTGGTSAVMAALDVLALLPRPTPVGRAVLAAAVLRGDQGGEHGLDDHAPVGRLVLAGLAARRCEPVPSGAAERAGLWATAGVSVDAVSVPALTLGLRPTPVGPLTEAACRWADSGIPLPVPASALSAEEWRLPSGTIISICENPTVLEAAAASLSTASPPVVCVSGMPGRAVTLLLDALSEAGCLLRYHGDFGAGGITIANLVIDRHRASPWRMWTADHAEALERMQSSGRELVRLRGRVPDASWDRELAPAITACGFEITEERVLEELLDDLRTAARLDQGS